MIFDMYDMYFVVFSPSYILLFLYKNSKFRKGMMFYYSFSTNAVVIQILPSDLCLNENNCTFLHNSNTTVFLVFITVFPEALNFFDYKTHHLGEAG